MGRVTVAATAAIAVWFVTGCGDVDAPWHIGDIRDPPAPPPHGEPFDGIDSVEWTGGDALTAAWSADTEPDARYRLSVEDDAGVLVAEATTTDLTLEVKGLIDGEYVLWVESLDPDGGGTGADTRLRQLVGENRVVHRGDVPSETSADVWGSGDVVVHAGWNDDFSFRVIDVSNPRQPVTLATVANQGYAKDVKIVDDILFVSNEQGTYGVRIFDFSNPANPVLLSKIGSPHNGPFFSVHNLWVEGATLYTTDNVSGGVSIFDVSEPADPVFLTTYYPPIPPVHDQVVKDGKLYVAWWEGFSVVDVSDPANPVELWERQYGGPASNCHNAWPSDDHSLVLTSDEIAGGHLRIWDAADPAQVTQIAEWRPPDEPDAMIHNVHVRGRYAFMAHYGAGLRVVDLRDPANPVQVGVYDTESGSGMWGTWGVWPYGRHVALGSMSQGLQIVDFFPHVVTRED